MPLMTANSFFGLALEATRGTAASVSTYTPVQTPQLAPDLKWLPDEALRGSPVMIYDQVPGVRSDKFTGKVYIYDDVYPQLLRATLGSSDTTASVGPSLWTHTIGLFNSASVGSQPPSYTVVNNSVDNTYQLVAAQCSDLSISATVEAAIETSFTFIGNPETTISLPTIAESTEHMVPAWDVAASISGASVAVIEDLTIDIKRNAAPIFTAGAQSPYQTFAGPIEVTGKLVFVVETGQSFFANSLTRAQNPLVVLFTDPVSTHSVKFQMSAVQLEAPQIKQSKAYVQLDCNFTAVANTTDAVGGGYSPIKTVTTNGISTSY